MNNRTVILAAGDFPKKNGFAWRILNSARRVVACDSAAELYFRRLHKWPDIIVGDLDSLTRRPKSVAMIEVSEQDTNDLEKAIRYCKSQGWKQLVILGAFGKREDHAIGNVFRGLEYGIEIITDYGRFVPIFGKATLQVDKGAAISVFTTDKQVKMTSKGLEWPLNDVSFDNLYCATLNRATAKKVVLTSTKPVYVYIAL